MHLRLYKTGDFENIVNWITDERTHALWCANRFPYPLTQEGFHKALEQNEKDWGDQAYIVMDDKERSVGFFTFSINEKEQFGFLKFVVIDSELRGQGIGTQMIKLLLDYAFQEAGLTSVKLNVFDINEGARKCYQKAGFVEVSTTPNAFSYGEESWGRCFMVKNI